MQHRVWCVFFNHLYETRCFFHVGIYCLGLFWIHLRNNGSIFFMNRNLWRRFITHSWFLWRKVSRSHLTFKDRRVIFHIIIYIIFVIILHFNILTDYMFHIFKWQFFMTNSININILNGRFNSFYLFFFLFCLFQIFLKHDRPFRKIGIWLMSELIFEAFALNVVKFFWPVRNFIFSDGLSWWKLLLGISHVAILSIEFLELFFVHLVFIQAIPLR